MRTYNAFIGVPLYETVTNSYKLTYVDRTAYSYYYSIKLVLPAVLYQLSIR